MLHLSMHLTSSPAVAMVTQLQALPLATEEPLGPFRGDAAPMFSGYGLLVPRPENRFLSWQLKSLRL